MARQSYRKRKRNTLRRFLTKLSLFVMMFFAVVIGATIFFKVEMIVVEGNSHYTDEEIIAATNIRLGENLFSIKQDEISKNITYVLPYVQSVEIKLHLPTGIRLVVEEQKGMVQLVTEEGVWYMGVQGKLLEYTPSYQNAYSSPNTENLGEENFEGSYENLEFVEDSFESNERIGINGITFLTWQEDVQQELEFDPEVESYIKVTGIVPIDPVAGESLEVSEEQERQLSALLALFQELENQNLFQKVEQISLHPYLYLEFEYDKRFTVKLPFSVDYNYKIRALQAAVADIESYETGVMDLTQTDYVVLFTPD
ncbi:MAG: FtsQ-type POTRA domain-containing protein [Eubacteriales bacterium]